MSFLKEAGRRFCVCSGCARKLNLTGWRGPRTSERPARHVFHRIKVLARGHHDRVLAVSNPVHSQCPATMQHIQTASRKRDGRESYGKQCTHCQEFPHEIRLQRNQHCQEHLHPLPALVLGLHLYSISPGHYPDCTSAASLFPASSVALPLTWMHQLARKVQHHPSYLYHLTAFVSKMRWYTRYIFGPKRVS